MKKKHAIGFILLSVLMSNIIYAEPIQHGYVLSNEQINAQGIWFDFFHNGDAMKWVAAHMVRDNELSHTKAKILNQENMPVGMNYGFVIRTVGSQKYMNDDNGGKGNVSNPNRVLEPGFWAINLNSYSIKKIADIMYTFKFDEACKQFSAPSTNLQFQIINADDWNPAATIPFKGINNFNQDARFYYDGGVYPSHNISIKVYYTEGIFDSFKNYTYYLGRDGKRINGDPPKREEVGTFTPGVYQVSCEESKDQRMYISKQERFTW